MLVFVTGATGFVGAAVVSELLAAGHTVRGLCRSAASASSLQALSVQPHLGSIDDLDSLRRGIDGVDAVVHTAFDHDFSKFMQSCTADKRAVEAMGACLVGSARPFIVTSAMGVVPQHVVATEDTAAASGAAAHPRAQTETAADVVANSGVRTSVVRLPPSVHGVGDTAFVPTLIGMAKKAGVSAFTDAGANRWPAVHRFDAARLYRLLVEHGNARGTFHAVDDEGIAFKDIAAAIGAGAGVPTQSMSMSASAAHFGWFMKFASLDIPASSAKTRALLGWTPTYPGLLADLADVHYFETT